MGYSAGILGNYLVSDVRSTVNKWRKEKHREWFFQHKYYAFLNKCTLHKFFITLFETIPYPIAIITNLIP